MTKVEVPTSVLLYVQWILHPFPSPHIAEQKRANSQWACEKTKNIIGDSIINPTEVSIAVQENGLVRVEIFHPSQKLESGQAQWKEVFLILKINQDIVSISVYVNNDISDYIAANIADQVPRPWRTGYMGLDTSTLIYHK